MKLRLKILNHKDPINYTKWTENIQKQLLVIINNESKVKKFRFLRFNIAKILVSVDDIIRLREVRFHFFLIILNTLSGASSWKIFRLIGISKPPSSIGDLRNDVQTTVLLPRASYSIKHSCSVFKYYIYICIYQCHDEMKFIFMTNKIFECQNPIF